VSQGEPMPRAHALTIADSLVGMLRPACERIEIAGSLRRQKPEVRDIELVAVARFEERPADDLWASPETHDVLEERVAELLSLDVVEARLVENHRADGSVDLQTKLGPSFKALVCLGMPVDLFVVRPPATWGCIFALRTGPGDWNTRLVMDCKAIGRRVEGGQVQRWAGSSWATVPTPEETDFFAALGQPWIEPAERRVERIRIDRAIADSVAA
jgi:DNA polymerase/3'-5' exonuclease PolX